MSSNTPISVSWLSRWCTVVLLLLVAGLNLGAAGPDDIDEVKAASVKAAYLYNFVNATYGLVMWPDRAYAHDKAPVVIGVLGKDPFGKVLDQTVAGKTSAGRAIRVKRLTAWPATSDAAGLERARNELRGCHLLFICSSERARAATVLDALGSAPVLTVSDVPKFARSGGMVELVLQKGRIVPHINRRTAERAQLRLSAKLLKLATIVEDRP